MRVTLGTIFLTTGVVKFGLGLGNFAGATQQQFAGKLPVLLITPFAYSLPFLEVTVGALLVIGLFNVTALVSSGLLLLALTFAMTAQNDTAVIAHNLANFAITFVLLWLADHNGYSVDRLRRRNRTDGG